MALRVSIAIMNSILFRAGSQLKWINRDCADKRGDEQQYEMRNLPHNGILVVDIL